MSIENVKKACQVLTNIHKRIAEEIKPGVDLKHIDNIAGALMEEHGAQSAPIVEYKFPGFICISLNDIACHGVPESTPLDKEDVVNVDISIVYEGFFADASRTYYFGEDPKIKELIQFTRELNKNIIESIKLGDKSTSLGEKAYELCKKSKKYAIVENFGGHFIGEKLHVKPFVPSIVRPEHVQSYLSKEFAEGDCFCFEPIVTFGKNLEVTAQVYSRKDSWNVYQLHGFKCVHLENTYGIVNGQCVSLTGEIW